MTWISLGEAVAPVIQRMTEQYRMDTEFPYVFRLKLAGRHGQRCQIIGKSLYGVRVVFEDGWITNVSRQALRHAAKVTAPEPQRSLEPVSIAAVGEP
jgi:orotate phosphoribosyltransferase